MIIKNSYILKAGYLWVILELVLSVIIVFNYHHYETMRTKVIVLCITGIIVIALLYLIFLSLPKNDNTTQEIKLRSDLKSGYTLEEMMKEVKKNNGSPKYDQQVQDSSEKDLARIQELIRQNEAAFQQPLQPVEKKPHTETRVKKESAAVKDSSKISRSVKPKRRTFNSIRLVKEDETNAIKAFVHSTQTVMVGSTLKMQLSENCLTDNGLRIKKGTPVYGEVTAIDGERVIVKISSININNNILPFKKNVYSRDAIEGIYVPGNPKSEVAKDAGAAATSGANANISGGIDIGSQLVAGAANSVINATKSATSQNIRKIKVTIKTNYQILLMKDNRR